MTEPNLLISGIIGFSKTAIIKKQALFEFEKINSNNLFVIIFDMRSLGIWRQLIECCSRTRYTCWFCSWSCFFENCIICPYNFDNHISIFWVRNFRFRVFSKKFKKCKKSFYFLNLRGWSSHFKGFSIANCRKSTNRSTNFYLSYIYLNKNLAS